MPIPPHILSLTQVKCTENKPKSEINQCWDEIMEHLNEVTRRQEAEK